MCNLGVLWNYESPTAAEVLRQRQEFLKPLREHEGWYVDQAASAAIFGELIANVVEHTPGAVRAWLSCEGGDVVLRVEDDGAPFILEPRLPSNIFSEGGRGLFIAAQYALRLTIERGSRGGKALVAILPRATV
jgi:anti-sigma regulatory factor (Ser/Thr protein kinase)